MTEISNTMAIKEMIQQVLKSGPGIRAGCSFDEYLFVAEQVLQLTPCNFLIFGTGRDSALWEFCNRGGTTVFLEHISEWIKIGRESTSCEIHQVKYTTKTKDWKAILKRNNPKELNMKLPASVCSTKWDVIFVDSPNQGRPGAHGRMQSIYAAAKLSNMHKGPTYVFVHDCLRLVENPYGEKYLGKNNKVAKVQNMQCYCINCN